jgi:hypothetical protein
MERSDGVEFFGLRKWLFLLQDRECGRYDEVRNLECWGLKFRVVSWSHLPTTRRDGARLRRLPARCGSFADRMHCRMRSVAT